MSVNAIGTAAPHLASLQQSQAAVSVDADGDRDGDTKATETAAEPSTTINALGQTLGAKVNTTA